MSRPQIDFDTGFKMAAKAAGLGDNFDAFENVDCTIWRVGKVREFLGTALFTEVHATSADEARHQVLRRGRMAI